MRYFIALTLILGNMYAMESYIRPKSLATLAAGQAARIIIANNALERAARGILNADPIPAITDQSIHVAQFITRQNPGIVTSYTQQCPIDSKELMAPATKHFDIVKFSHDGSKLASRVQGRGFLGLAIYDIEQQSKLVSFLDTFRDSPIDWVQGSDSLVVIDAEKRPCLYDYKRKNFFNRCPLKTLCQPCIFRDGTQALAANETMVYTWDLHKNTTCPFYTHEQPEPIIPLTYAHNKDALCCSADALMLLSEKSTYTSSFIPSLRTQMTSVMLAPDNRFLIVCLRNGTIQYWDLLTGKHLHDWTLHDQIHQGNMAPDGNMISCVGMRNLLHLIDTRIHSCLKHICYFQQPTDHTFYSSDFHPNGILLATAGTKTLALWDLRKLVILKEYLLNKITAEQATCLSTIHSIINT